MHAVPPDVQGRLSMMIGVLVRYGLEFRLSQLGGDGRSVPSEHMRGHATARRTLLPGLTLLMTAVALAAACNTAPPDPVLTGQSPNDGQWQTE